MTEQRKKLINRFQSWLDTDPRKQIIAAVCANIAEEYAEQQLLLHNVSQQRELLKVLIDTDTPTETNMICLPHRTDKLQINYMRCYLILINYKNERTT